MASLWILETPTKDQLLVAYRRGHHCNHTNWVTTSVVSTTIEYDKLKYDDTHGLINNIGFANKVAYCRCLCSRFACFSFVCGYSMWCISMHIVAVFVYSQTH